MNGISPSSEALITKRKPSPPWQTVLTSYLPFINRLRQQSPPVSYRAIAQELERKYGVKVAHGTVRSAVIKRGKPRKKTLIHPSYFSQTQTQAAIAVSDNSSANAEWDKRLQISGPLIKYK